MTGGEVERIAKGRLKLLRGVGKIDGDGWKDTTSRGEVIYVYADPLPRPYGPPLQYERVGNVGWTASTRQYDFVRASFSELIGLLPTIWRDRPFFALYAFRRERTHLLSETPNG